MNRKSVIPAAVATVAIGSMFVATAASAAPANWPIHGTCPSNGGTFVSSNVRTMGGTKITVAFYTLPSKGMYFWVNYARSLKVFGSPKWIPAGSTKTYTLMSGAAKGTQFLNVFSTGQPGVKMASYSFTGDEGY